MFKKLFKRFKKSDCNSDSDFHHIPISLTKANLTNAIRMMRSMGDASEAPKRYCRLCGKEMGNGDSWKGISGNAFNDTNIFNGLPKKSDNPPQESDFAGICENCYKRIFEKAIGEMIPEKDINYCLDCKSHINACKCPKKKALEDLRK